MRYYIIAGEASGDLHASNLMRALLKKDPNSEFRYWGGDLMAMVQSKPVKHYKELAFMGFLEVLLNLRTILSNLKFCKKDILEYKPDAIIFVDYPGFNLRIAEWAKQQSIKTIYYISPQIWAWKQSRVHKIKRDIDKMICILPFEQEFYAKYNMEVDYVGHPLLDAVSNRPEANRERKLEEWGLSSDKKLMALLPGSRKQEISTILPIMLKSVQRLSNFQFAIAVAPSQDLEFYQSIVKSKNIALIPGQTYEILELADMALVTSGTATLETAIFNVPEVVCYKGSWVSYWIAKQLVKIKFISLVNLIMDKELVKEMIQAECNPKAIELEIMDLVKGDKRESLLQEYKELQKKLGGVGASERTADLVLNFLGR